MIPISAAIYDYHQPWEYESQKIHLCGGYTDRNGITWERKGDFIQYPGEDYKKLESRYGYWWPTVNPTSMVNSKFLSDAPKDISKEASKQYEILISMSHLVHKIYRERYMPMAYGTDCITREFNSLNPLGEPK